LALFELHENKVVATPFRFGVEPIVEDTFWRSVLPLFLQHRGVQVLHASAVVGPDGVVGFCGRAGAGKSTVAYGLSRRGYRLWSDDALVLSSVEPLRTRALAGAMRLMPDVRERFGLSQQEIVLEGEAGEERDFSLLVVLSADPAVPGGGPQVLNAGEAFAAVIEHAYCYDLEMTKRAMTADYLAFLEDVPVVQISRPDGFDGLEGLLDKVEGLMAGGPP
jgi:hypothetical protein